MPYGEPTLNFLGQYTFNLRHPTITAVVFNVSLESQFGVSGTEANSDQIIQDLVDLLAGAGWTMSDTSKVASTVEAITPTES